MSSADNPFRVLGLARTALQPEIRRRYRELALKYHPDKQKAADRKAAAERFARVQDAYEKLQDAAERRKFAADLQTGRKTPASDARAAPSAEFARAFSAFTQSHVQRRRWRHNNSRSDMYSRGTGGPGFHFSVSERPVSDLFSSFFGGSGVAMARAAERARDALAAHPAAPPRSKRPREAAATKTGAAEQFRKRQERPKK